MQTNPPVSAPRSSSALRHPGGKRELAGVLVNRERRMQRWRFHAARGQRGRAREAGRGEASAKPKPQIRWFVILLLALKPLAIAGRGKGEAEMCRAPGCARHTSGWIFPSPFPIHPPPPWAEDALREAQSPAWASSPH